MIPEPARLELQEATARYKNAGARLFLALRAAYPVGSYIRFGGRDPNRRKFSRGRVIEHDAPHVIVELDSPSKAVRRAYYLDIQS